MSVLHCPMCEATVADDARFCGQCGAPLSGAAGLSARRGSDAPTQRARPQPPRSGSAAGDQAARPQRITDQPEREIWSGTFSAYGMLGAWASAAGLTVLALAGGGLVAAGTREPLAVAVAAAMAGALWLYLLAVYGYRRLSIRYRLTTLRFFHEAGILHRVVHRIELIDVRDVVFSQTILERLFAAGAIQIVSSDETHPRLVLRGIADVRMVVDLLESTCKQVRRERLSYIERV